VSVVANVAINVDSRNAVSKLRQVQSQSQATERAVGNLGAAVGKLAAALGVIQAARFVFVKTAELESQARSLQVLTGSAEKAGQIIKELQQLGAVTPFTSSELIDSAKRLQAFGVETNKVVETTRRLADVSGATGAELQGLVTAYGQVQAKGKLQGEELLQFQERGVALQQELRKQYNLSGEEFQDALSKGKISAEAVEFAIQSLTNAGGKYANGAIAQSDTLNGRFSTLQDGIEALARRIGQVLTPELKAVFNQAIAVVDAINAALAAGRGGAFTRSVAGARQFLNIGATSQAVDNIAQGVAQISSQKNKAGIQQNLQALQQYQRLLQSVGPNDPNAGRAVQLQGQILTKINQNLEAQKQLQSGTKQTDKLFTPPPLLDGTGGKGRTGKTDAEKAVREAEKLAQEIQRSLELGDRLGTEFSRQVLLLGEASEIEQKRLQIQFDYEDRAKQIAELKNTEQQTNLSQLNDEIRRLEIIDLQTEALKNQLEEYYKLAGLKAGDMLPGGAGAFRTDINLMPGAGEQQMAKYREELEALTNPINMAVTGANAIGDAFGTAFQDIATGAKSTQEALADAFKSIGSAFISMATEIIAKQMAMIVFQTILKALGGGGGGAFSGAGPVAMPGAGVGGGSSMFMPGAPSLFAEGGFVTGPTNALIGEGGESEYVIPASKMRGAMSRYAGGARGNNVIPGSGAEGGTEQGGVATMEPIDVRYSVERINSVDYVTADQFQRGMQQAAAQGAKQGEQRALSTLKQNTNVRRSVGI
jgi:tape measure domain-containing protein